MSRLRLAAIGAGGIARRHLDALARTGEVRPVAHLARSVASAEQQAQRYGGSAYQRLDAMLDDAGPEVVLITVPPAAHGEAEFACLERGIPFLVEKPLSAGAQPAERIAERVASSGVIAAVGYHWRALPGIPELRERLGDRPPRLVTGAWHTVTPPPTWWHTRAGSGGQMVEQATHLLDLARHLLGEPELLHAAEHPAPPSGVPGADVAAASSATLRWPDGALGVFTATCALAASTTVEVAFASDGLHARVRQDGVTYDDGRELRTVRAQQDPFETEWRAFLAAVRSGDASGLYCDYQDALGSHRLLQRIAVAARGDAPHGSDDRGPAGSQGGSA